MANGGLLTAEDERRVSAAITDAEARTSGEIVAVIAERSGSFALFAMMWAALFALLVPWPLIYLTWWPMQWVFGLQLAVFVALLLLLNTPWLRGWIVPAGVQRRWAHGRAVEQFLALNMHTTTGRTGVMIFVSVAERYAQIIADTGIYAKVPSDTWQDIVDTLTAHIADDRAAEGFISAIETAGALLSEQFPQGSHDKNQLPNHLIVLR